MERNYLVFDPLKGYPAGKNVFYECKRGGDFIPSQPSDVMGCSCKNVYIDVDAGRVSVKDETKFKIFKK